MTFIRLSKQGFDRFLFPCQKKQLTVTPTHRYHTLLFKGGWQPQQAIVKLAIFKGIVGV
jgi:hypothetical protein